MTPHRRFLAPLDFFPVDWSIDDRPDTSTCVITVRGKTVDGETVLCRLAYYPFFFVAIPPEWTPGRKALLMNEVFATHDPVHKYTVFVDRKDLWGFTNNQSRTFLQVAFSSLQLAKRAKYGLKRSGYKTYESSIDPLIRFFHVRDLRPAQWCRLTSWTTNTDDTILDAVFTDIHPCPDVTERRPPLILASYDLECYSASGAFPLAHKPDDAVITIGVTFQKWGDPEPYKRLAICLHDTDPLPPEDVGIEIVSCDTEGDVIATFYQVLDMEHTDVVLGYNNWQFDDKYLYNRAELCVDEYGEPTLDASELGKPKEWELNSGAYGDNTYFMMHVQGRMHMDVLQLIRREYKLASYSLNAVASQYLQDSKIDLPAGDIFRKFKESAAGRAEIAKYCVKDTELPLQLVMKLCLLENMLEMSNATICPPSYLVSRGQQIKAFSQITHFARRQGFLVPDDAAMGIEGKFEGATVLHADKNAHMEIVAGLDFASLYPSIMRAYNLCYTSIVLDPNYANVPGIEYHTVKTALGTYMFAQDTPSILPGLLAELAHYRTKAKKDMADAKNRGDEFAAAVFNAKQLSMKISMNSVYGFCGASRGYLPCVGISASTTAIGRDMLQKTKTYVESIGGHVVYGDSVASYTPVYIRHNGLLDICSIDQVADTYGDGRWIECVDMGRQNKHVCQLPGDVETWSEEGWTTLDRIVRHELAPHKKILRVLTHTGLVDVTDDHSLLDVDGRCVRTNEVHVGMALMHHPLPDATNADTSLSEDEARIMGRLMYSENCKVVPGCVLNGPENIRLAFWTGLCDADGDKGIKCNRIDQKNQIRQAHITWLGHSLGYNVSLNSIGQDEKPSMTTMTMTGSAHRKDPNRIEKISECDDVSGYVYDLTTRNHHFAAGVGTLIVHNTDSVMCKLYPTLQDDQRYDMAAHFVKAEAVAADITKLFKPPIQLEFEKCYYPYFLVSKKRYAGLMFTNPHKPDYIDVKGLSLVRRDSCALVKDVSERILEKLMHDRDPDAAHQVARDAIVRIVSRQEPIEKFVVSKTLRNDYKNANQAHVGVARKIETRTGQAPPSGSRVPYVFVKGCLPKSLQVDRSEDPEFAREHNMELDVLYYIEHQLTTPITTLLGFFGDAHEAVFGHPGVKALMDAEREDARIRERIAMNKAAKQPEITKFFFREDT
jgi:DNA polymerase delta subunit 1